MTNNTEQQPPMPKRRNKRTVGWFVMLGLVMFAFSFAMIPLYRLVCSVTGINSVTTAGERVPIEEVIGAKIDRSRSITVEFDGTLNGGLDWDFYPNVKKVQVHPGEIKTVSYYARNRTDRTITVQAVPGITPWQATRSFHKIECFCFTQQTLDPGEEVDMGLQFVVNHDMPKDVKVLTLSYTMMDTDRGMVYDRDDADDTKDANTMPEHQHGAKHGNHDSATKPAPDHNHGQSHEGHSAIKHQHGA